MLISFIIFYNKICVKIVKPTMIEDRVQIRRRKKIQRQAQRQDETMVINFFHIYVDSVLY
jgi:hypothetical protein